MSKKLKNLLNIQGISDQLRDHIKDFFNFHENAEIITKGVILSYDSLEILLELLSYNKSVNVLFQTTSGNDALAVNKINRNKKSFEFIEYCHSDEYLKETIKKVILLSLKTDDIDYLSMKYTLSEAISLSIHSPDEDESYKFLLKKFLETSDLAYLLLSIMNITQIKRISQGFPDHLIPYKDDFFIFYNQLIGDTNE